MKHKILIIILTTIIPTLLLAETEELPSAKIKVKLAVASNYVSKGSDQFSNRALQNGVRYGQSTGAPLFHTAITILPPATGFFFKAKAYFALAGREDQDVDGFIQKGPGADNLLSGLGSNSEQVANILNKSGLYDVSGQLNSLNSNLTGPLSNPDCVSSSSCVPSYYKEENGLFRKEEVKSYYGYKRKTSIGKISFALKYKYAISKNVNRSSSNSAIFEYSLPKLSQLQLYTEHSIKASKTYLRLRWVDKTDLTQFGNNPLKIEYLAGVGYGNQSYLKGIQDVTSRLGLFYNGFRIGANITWRPDLRFHDSDKKDIGSDSLPVWLVGDSSRADGLVVDPSRLYGHTNAIINESIQSNLNASGLTYTYKPRQKLPRQLVWIDFSYSFEIY